MLFIDFMFTEILRITNIRVLFVIDIANNSTIPKRRIGYPYVPLKVMGEDTWENLLCDNQSIRVTDIIPMNVFIKLSRWITNM